MLYFYELSVKKSYQTSSNSHKKSRWNNDVINLLDVVTWQNAEGGPVTSMSMQTAKGSMMGATTAMTKQRKRQK
jgi:hypothetical protein